MKREEQQRCRAAIPEKLQEAGGLRDGAARRVAEELGIPEAHVYGVGSFFHLLSAPDVKLRVCQGLSCRLEGAEEVLQQAKDAGLAAEGCSCLAMCDHPVPALEDRNVLATLTTQSLEGLQGDSLYKHAVTHQQWQTNIGPQGQDPSTLVNRLHMPHNYDGASYQKAVELGSKEVIDIISASGLQGRGGAGFSAGFKWKSVAAQTTPTKYVVLNADEGEPGTFKDREVLMRRPDTVVEGLAIAATMVGATDIYCYLRGAFTKPWDALQQAIDTFQERGLFPSLNFHLHAGQGAYICGEETALLEALEGKRGMPRNKPPYPTVEGLWGKPTLVHNVETIACVPAILERGAEWFRDLGRTGPGTKLYCISGHVEKPGVYELPLGVHLDELVEAAGGYIGTLKAFSPGGASSGFLPASERKRPLDFKSLTEVGSMLGSAGVVVLNETVDMVWAAQQQLIFFEDESCGQCAPCRIGTRFLRETMERFVAADNTDAAREILSFVDEVAWEMNEGSICGLGMVAPLPLTSAMRWFPEEFTT
tara:strand:- start:2810 stop:4414 length:1605 start_codon:yes stop_codon:yes gene_type:complete